MCIKARSILQTHNLSISNILMCTSVWWSFAQVNSRNKWYLTRPNSATTFWQGQSATTPYSEMFVRTKELIDWTKWIQGSGKLTYGNPSNQSKLVLSFHLCALAIHWVIESSVVHNLLLRSPRIISALPLWLAARSCRLGLLVTCLAGMWHSVSQCSTAHLTLWAVSLQLQLCRTYGIILTGISSSILSCIITWSLMVVGFQAW